MMSDRLRALLIQKGVKQEHIRNAIETSLRALLIQKGVKLRSFRGTPQYV